MKKVLHSLLFVIPLALVLLALFSPTYANDNFDSYATQGNFTTHLYTIKAASTTLNSNPINVVGKKKLWLNVYIPVYGAATSAPLHIGAVTRPIFVEAKLGTLTSTTMTDTAASNIGWASTWIPYTDDVSSATASASISAKSKTVPSRLGLYGPIDIEGIPLIRLCARGVAEASDINVEIGLE